MGGLGVRRSGGCEIGRYGGLEQGTSLLGPGEGAKGSWRRGKRSDRG